MELKLVAKLSQQHVMTPQLKMAINLLTLNHLELRDAVAKELVDNPVLEETYGDDTPTDQNEDRPPAEPEPGAVEAKTEVAEINLDKPGSEKDKDNNSDIDWDNYADSYSYLPPSAGSGRDTSYDDMPGYDQTLTRSETLEEHLLWQVRMNNLKELEVEIAQRLLGEMNDDGFLHGGPTLAPPELSNEGEPIVKADAPAPEKIDPVQLVATDLDVPLEWVENVRHKMMRFDPVGCLARDLRESLLTQLEIWGYDDECLVYNIIDKHIHDMERRNYQDIAKALDVPLKEVGEALKLVEQLEPRPARNYLPAGQSETAQYITPDVYMGKVGDDYVISLNEDGLPKLRMSEFYLDKLRSKERDQSTTYIKTKMRAAQWLIRSIHQRQRTIYKVVESILKYQRDWFEGTGELKPLILKEVADDIEMHESTVSRVTTRKYLHCHRGIFELKYFFNSSISTGDGTSIASEAVKEQIKRIVCSENPKKPFSDASIVKQLKEDNIDIARRTVAKYREMLGILPSNKRKQVF